MNSPCFQIGLYKERKGDFGSHAGLAITTAAPELPLEFDRAKVDRLQGCVQCQPGPFAVCWRVAPGRSLPRFTLVGHPRGWPLAKSIQGFFSLSQVIGKINNGGLFESEFLDQSLAEKY